ncbi:MAG: hypothetical protein LBD67_06585 [Candidatus Accumulibacter sp.]|nr:hypothetical protein [Accumulibacter sp.]
MSINFVGTHRQHLSPFVLSLSKYERTLQGFPKASSINRLRQTSGGQTGRGTSDRRD